MLDRNYSGTKETVIPQESLACGRAGFFYFKHCSGAKKDSSRMTCAKMLE